MSDSMTQERDNRGDWWPAQPIMLPPLNRWPVNLRQFGRWLFGYPGYLWPNNIFWLVLTLITWFWFTPALSAMQNLELWWAGLILLRNAALFMLICGGLHLYLFILRRQGDAWRYSAKPLATDSGRFKFRHQTRDNMFRTMVYGVPIFTAFEVVTYWAFANGYLGLFELAGGPVVFWAWFGLMLLLAPAIHVTHFYFGHRLLHTRWLYRRVHASHHHNVDVGPWSGIAMHPLEIAIYFSTVVVQWLLALHPVNALFQLQLTLYYAAMAHSGVHKFSFGGGKVTVEAGGFFHYLHHKYFECNYGGSLVCLDALFGMYHDGSDAATRRMRERLKRIRQADAVAAG